MNRYLIKADEALIKSFIKIHKSINRIYGCSLGLDAFDTMGKILDDPYVETVANIDINELNIILKIFFHMD